MSSRIKKGFWESDKVRALNSATKYGSIPNYHEIIHEGFLGKVMVDFGKDVSITEKVDGTNGRIVFLPEGDYMIGSKEELIFARGDRVRNDRDCIIETLAPIAERIRNSGAAIRTLNHTHTGLRNGYPFIGSLHFAVFYFEVYGFKIGSNYKNYAKSEARGARLFDVAECHEELLYETPEDIALRRKSKNPEEKFLSFAAPELLRNIAGVFEVETVPYIEAPKPPESHQVTLDWLTEVCPHSLCSLENEAIKAPEGVIVRNDNRSRIAKIKFDLYRRHFRRLQKKDLK